MRNDLYEEMYQLEESYWWHVAKRRLVKRLVRGIDKRGVCFVDIGCGTGKLAAEMKEWGFEKVLGLDGSEIALRYCAKRMVGQTVLADFEQRLPLRDKSVDLITSLDVVEHIQRDEALLKEFGRILKPGGMVIITVPAYRWLWTYWDEMLQHKRRYTAREVRTKIEKAGLKIERISYFYSYLLPIAVLFRILKTLGGLKTNKNKGSDFVVVPKWLNWMLLSLSYAESVIVEDMNIPAGLSIVCVGRKRG